VLMGGLMIHGLAPGPMLFKEHPDVVTGIFVGSFVANIFMFLFGMMGIRYFSRILDIPKKILTVSIVVFCFIGSYAINMNAVDLYTMLGFGVLGYVMQKYNFSQAALCIALILGPMAESNLRLGLMSANQSIVAFCSGPITLTFLLLSVVSLVWPVIRERRRKGNAAQAEVLSETN